MNLDAVGAGVTVFIDANIFIYHFTGASEECTALLSRCEQGELDGVTAVNAQLEVLHRLMLVEAVNKKLVEPPHILNKLRKQPQKIRQLSDYYVNTQRILEMGVRVLPVLPETIVASHHFRTGYGMMVNDSIIAAVMQGAGLTSIATNDGQFKKIHGLSVFSPADMKL
jgi:predicted nucleic acid-binding protein